MVFKDDDGTHLWYICSASEIKSKLASFVDFLNIFFYSTMRECLTSFSFILSEAI